MVMVALRLLGRCCCWWWWRVGESRLVKELGQDLLPPLLVVAWAVGVVVELVGAVVLL